MDQKNVNMGEWEQKSLVNELSLGRELAKQLQLHLNVPSSSSQETREMLVQKILASYEKALSMLTLSSSGSPASGIDIFPGGVLQQPLPTTSGLALTLSESPTSLSGSPRSEDSDPEHRSSCDASRKRKSIPRWTQQVRVTPGMGLEGPLDDGFSWRKYGQKDILGAKYPRGYYRCTHRNVQGCLATKQVQRSDEDSTIFEVTYRGRHTCAQHNPVPQPQQQPLQENQEPTNNTSIITTTTETRQQQQQSWSSQELLLNFRTGLKVVTQDLDNPQGSTPNYTHQSLVNSFHFPGSSSDVHQAPESHVFSSPPGSFSMGSISPAFGSPSTSGTNYLYSGSTSGMTLHQSFQNFPDHHNSELSEIISGAATSAANSPTVGLDFPFGNVDFDPNFSFDNRGFL